MSPRRSIALRSAGPADAVPIAALHANSWRIVYRGLLADRYLDETCPMERLSHWSVRLSEPAPDQYLTVATDHDEVIGFCCVYGARDPLWGSYINNLHVAEAHQGLGIGAALLARATDTCRLAHGDTPAYLWVAEANVAAQHVYHHLGGRHAGETLWEAPGGTTVPLWRYAWPALSHFEERRMTPAPTR